MPATLITALIGAAAAGSALQPQPTSDEAWAETYTAVATLDDGSFVLMQLLFTNAGFGDGRSACRALHVAPGTSGTNASADVGAGEWSWDAGTGRLVVGPCSLGAEGSGTRFRAALDGLSIDLQIAAPVSPVTPPDHRIDVDGAFYESDLLIPWGKVTATVNGAQRSGAAHLDHSRSNTLLPKVADCWMRFRGFYGAPTLLQVRLPPEGAAPAAWSWPLSEAAPSTVSPGDVSVGAEGKTLQIDGLSVTTTRTIYRYRPTESYGALGKLASPWIGDPTTTTYSARATNAAGQEITGILEVSEIASGGCAAR